MQIKDEFRKLIPPLSVEEFKQLEANCLADGIRDAILTWNGFIIDGHNRYEIAQRHGLTFKTESKEFESELDVKEWMINNQFGRRNLSNYQRSVLALELEDVFRAKAKESKVESVSHFRQTGEVLQKSAKPDTRKELANIANVSHDTIAKVKVIEAKATPEVKAQLSTGEVSINQVYQGIKQEEKAVFIAAEKAKKDVMLNAIIEEVQYKYIHNISILDAEDKIPNGIKLLLTDPPYGMGFKSNRRVISEKDSGIDGDESIDEAVSLLDKTLALIYGKMQGNSFAFVFTGWRHEPEFRAVFEKYFTLRNSIIWVKPNHGTGDLQGSFAPKHERILFGVKGNPKLKYRLPDVLSGSKIETEHPTSKPIDLLIELINVCTEEGDMIIEPFAGHGSTILAALKTGRKVFATEIDNLNYKNIIKNVSDYNKFHK